MTGEEMERAIDFLLKSQANLEARIEQVNANLGARIDELSHIVQMQATSQSELNQTLTRAITNLADAQVKTGAKLDQLIDVVRGLQSGPGPASP
jgi:uncharacterized coiled-coil protein SlyX